MCLHWLIIYVHFLQVLWFPVQLASASVCIQPALSACRLPQCIRQMYGNNVSHREGMITHCCYCSPFGLKRSLMSAPLIYQQIVHCSTHPQHVWRQKLCCRRATCVEQPPSTLLTTYNSFRHEIKTYYWHQCCYCKQCDILDGIVCAACSVRRVWEVLHVLVFCYGTSAFCDMILCCIEVLHMVVRLAVLICWFDALFRPSLTLAMLRCLALCWHVLADMLDVHVSRPGCRGRVYVCLRLYAFDCDGVTCWPACTRLLCNDGSWKPTNDVISEQSTDLQSDVWTVCTSTNMTGPVAVSFRF